MATFRRWADGKTSVPKPVFAYLKLKHQAQRCDTLGPQFGPWSGWRLSKRGDGLVCPWNRNTSLYTEDAVHITEYRQASDLAKRQAELIERLMIERNFYRERCTREAKFGLMLNRVFWCPGK